MAGYVDHFETHMKDVYLAIQTVQSKITRQGQGCERCRQALLLAANPLDDQVEDEVDELDIAEPPLERDDTNLRGLSTSVAAIYKAQSQHLAGHRDRSQLKVRVPNCTNGAFHLPAQKYQFLPHDPDFDQYDGGPSLDAMFVSLDARIGAFGVSIANPIYVAPNPSETFIDRGYRIERNFASPFNSDTPRHVLDHFLSIGPDVEEPPLPPKGLGHDGAYNIFTASIEDMMSWELENGSQAHLDAFIGGRDPSDRPLCLSLEHDRCTLSDEEIIYSTDIDSVIYVTHRLKVVNHIALHVHPIVRHRPPIYKHNHVYVEVLLPQSDEDSCALGPRTEWQSKRYRLSVIPHMPFAKVGEGSGSFNVLVFFPRMMHKTQTTPRRNVVAIPFDIQQFWYTDVMQQAMRRVMPTSLTAYSDHTWQEWEGKGAPDHKTLIVQADVFEELQREMHRILREDYHENKELAHFGSFFFVVEAKGIKLSTSSQDDPTTARSPWEKLVRNYSSLDWDHMIDRKNGQLYVDIGCGWHPDPENGVPLIGIWRLSNVLRSYNASGFLAGDIHHRAMLGGYGNHSAEMPESRAAQVGIVNRLTYSLDFEVVRKSGKEEYFADLKEAYHLTAAYLNSIELYMKMYKDARKKPYGLRDEWRVGGRAVKIILSAAVEKVIFPSITPIS